MRRRAWLVLAGLAAGCGGDAADDSPFTSTLDQGQALGALGMSEKARLCAETMDRAARVYSVSRLHEPLCRRWAAAAAVVASTTTDDALEAGCRAAYDRCLTRASLELGGVLCPDAAAACAATVGQLAACVNDLERAYAAELASVRRCEDLTRSGPASAPRSSLPVPASCKAIRGLCPEVNLPWPPALVWTL